MGLSTKYPILFSINEDILPKQIYPNNGRRFDVSEMFDILNVSREVNDLHRIEVFDGALYIDPTNKIFNKNASQFWFNNSAFFDRDYLCGRVLFVPTRYDVYKGYDQII